MNPGAIIADRFEIEGLAGEGGMGAVYRGRDRSTGRAVAIKVLHDDRLDHSLRFEREAALLAALEHPAIVRYIAHGATETGRAYLVMDWLEGEALDARLAKARLSIDESVRLGRRVAEALGHAHAHGIIHRDLKPSNLILVGRSIDGVTLVDFGIARLPGRTLTETGAMLGTVGYMAPEQARGEPNIDARADVFSLGAVLFRCLTGQAAFDGPDPLAILVRLTEEDPVRPRAVRPEVPRALDDLVARMLSRSPLLRPADGDAVARALDAIAKSPPDPAELEPATHPAAVERGGPTVPGARRAVTLIAAPAPARAARLTARTFAVIAVSSAIAAVATAVAFSVVDAPRGRTPHAAATGNACPADVCEPFSSSHPEAMDMRDLIRASTTFAQRFEPAAKLIGAQAGASKNGAIDIRGSSMTGVTFTFPKPHDVTSGKGTGGMIVSFVNGMIAMRRFPYVAAIVPQALPEPGCASRAAWPVANRNGLAANATLILAYLPVRRRPGWLFTSVKTEPTPKTVYVDATDCRVTSP